MPQWYLDNNDEVFTSACEYYSQCPGAWLLPFQGNGSGRETSIHLLQFPLSNRILPSHPSATCSNTIDVLTGMGRDGRPQAVRAGTRFPAIMAQLLQSGMPAAI